MKNRAVFLDKDGTLIQNIPHNIDPSRISFLPQSITGLRRLNELGYKLYIISNQAGLAFNHFTEEQLQNMFGALKEMLQKEQVKIEDWYYCPHHPSGTNLKYRAECRCRKPKPGLLVKAAEDHGINMSESWMVGDILDDIEAGSRAGCRSILLDVGSETEWEITSGHRVPTCITNSLNEAATFILAHGLGDPGR